MRKKALPLIVLCAAVFFLVQCSGVQVPPDKQRYVGVWETRHGSPTYMHLTISAGGNVKYKRVEPGRSSSITSPISSWNGNNFKVGISIASTEFVVQRTPYRGRDGRWHMMVDGVDLIRR